jgi:hypothetical protein
MDDSFNFAHELLNAQYQFSRDVIGRFYPLLDYVRTERQPEGAVAPRPNSSSPRPTGALPDPGPDLIDDLRPTRTLDADAPLTRAPR